MLRALQDFEESSGPQLSALSVVRRCGRIKPGLEDSMDIERTMQFILEQQAQFANELIELTQRQLANEEALSSLADNQVRMQQAILDIAGAQVRTNEILATLAERQIATEESMRQLAERQSTTEETLNTLLLTVERHTANHKYPRELTTTRSCPTSWMSLGGG